MLRIPPASGVYRCFCTVVLHSREKVLPCSSGDKHQPARGDLATEQSLQQLLHYSIAAALASKFPAGSNRHWKPAHTFCCLIAQVTGSHARVTLRPPRLAIVVVRAFSPLTWFAPPRHDTPQKIKAFRVRLPHLNLWRLCVWPIQACEASLSLSLSRFSDSVNLLRPRRLDLAR